MHLMKCLRSLRQEKKMNTMTLLAKMGAHGGVHTGTYAGKLQGMGLEHGGTRLLGGFSSAECKWALCSVVVVRNEMVFSAWSH